MFVLPTLYEGHCNAIEEAKACGIPVISSKGTSVEAQIDPSIGVLIDPLNIEEIAVTIKRLKNDEASRIKMTKNLIAKKGENSIERRAQRISNLLYEFVSL